MTSTPRGDDSNLMKCLVSVLSSPVTKRNQLYIERNLNGAKKHSRDIKKKTPTSKYDNFAVRIIARHYHSLGSLLKKNPDP